MQRPLKLYVDKLAPDKSTGFTKNQKLVAYNVGSINALRNSKLDGDKIEVNEESVIIMAGNYVCVKMVLEDMKTLTLEFLDIVRPAKF